MKVAIMTDSNSGITQAEGEKLGIKVVPMPFMINGEEYYEDINLTQEGFYEFLTKGANVSTSQPSVGLVSSIFDELLESYDEIVYIPMSSGLSKSCESAIALAKDIYPDKVFVVDNQRISITQKQSVLDAMKLAKEGYTGSEIHKILTETKFESEIYLMVDTLKYLKKGGRITPAAAALGGALRIKPILQILGFKLDKFKMLNRTVDNAKRIFLEMACKVSEKLSQIKDRTGIHFAVAYSGTDNKEALDLVDRLKAEFGDIDIICNPLSLSVSCHIGNGALGVAITNGIPTKEGIDKILIHSNVLENKDKNNVLYTN